jgi:hypothetical protein
VADDAEKIRHGACEDADDVSSGALDLAASCACDGGEDTVAMHRRAERRAGNVEIVLAGRVGCLRWPDQEGVAVGVDLKLPDAEVLAGGQGEASGARLDDRALVHQGRERCLDTTGAVGRELRPGADRVEVEERTSALGESAENAVGDG